MKRLRILHLILVDNHLSVVFYCFIAECSITELRKLQTKTENTIYDDIFCTIQLVVKLLNYLTPENSKFFVFKSIIAISRD